MLNRSCSYALAALILLQTTAKTEAASIGMSTPHRCTTNAAATRCRYAQIRDDAILRVRDTRTSSAGGGRNEGENTCWSSCFKNYNDCVDAGPKNLCVTRMKSCLELCDRLSNKPRM
jgi:hypothetical protein